MTLEDIKKQLDRLEQATLLQKEVLNFQEAVRYTGFSDSYLYKLTSTKAIPHYCPLGKFLFFNRIELEEWLQRTRVTPKYEIEAEAEKYCMRKNMENYFKK